MTERTYQPEPVEIALRAWIVDVMALSALTSDAVVYYGNQGHVSISAPRVLVTVISDTALQDAERTVDEDSYLHTREHRSGTVQIACHGALSYAMARAISRSINDPDIVAANTARGVEIQSFVTGIMSLPETLSTTVEQRHIIDARFAYSEIFVSDNTVGVVERVIGESTVVGFEDLVLDIQWPATP